jgi:hypothetical protein
VAELTPIPAAQRPAEPGYQPLSGYAVAAVIVAGLFALLLVQQIVVGLLYRQTPLTYGLLPLAVGGIVLAVIGRAHVRNSEGTRTGGRMAGAAWWVCVLGGAGFAAFLGANYLVMEKESQRQADAFFEALKKGQDQEAFERSVLAPESRGRAAPGTPEFEAVYTPAGYAAFAALDLVRAFRGNGGTAQVEHVGAKDVGPEGAGFKATHVYRVTVAEGVFTVQVKMVAAEPKGGGKTQWHVQTAPALGVTNLSWDYFSQYGRLVNELEQEAEQFGRAWMFELSNGRRGAARLYTRPRAERDVQLPALLPTAELGGAVAVVVAPPGASGRSDFDDLLQAGFFRRDGAGSPLPEPKLGQLRELWASPNLGPATASRRNPMAGPEAGEKVLFAATPTGVTVELPADLILGPVGRQFAPAAVGVVCNDPVLAATLAAARERGAAAKDDGSLSVRTLPPRDWRVAWLQTDLEPPPAPPGPAGMPPRGGPPGS